MSKFVNRQPDFDSNFACLQFPADPGNIKGPNRLGP